MGKRYTPAEDRVILYSGKTARQIALELGRGYRSVQQRAHYLAHFKDTKPKRLRRNICKPMSIVEVEAYRRKNGIRSYGYGVVELGR